jgi:type I restriction enzyme S subunit
VDRIPLTLFPDLELSVPSLEEQREIAGVLAAYDDLIAVNRRRIERLEEAARLLYQEWFVQLRFPGHETVPVTNGVPKGWTLGAASDFIAIKPTTRHQKGHQIRYVPMAALSESVMLIDEAGTECRDKPTSVRFRNGDTLFARITPCLENGKTAFVDFLADGEVACGSTEFIVLRGKTISPEAVYCLSRTDAFRDNAIGSMTGSSGRQRVQEDCFDRFMMLRPDEETAARFDRIASGMFEQVRNLSIQNQRLAEARDILLPRLMSGEITP